VRELFQGKTTSAAKAVGENRPIIAAVNRCATQKQEQKSSFYHSVLAAIEAGQIIAIRHLDI